jgi:hypothetical protein
MAIGTYIPVKSKTNQTKIDGTQPTTKARQTEVAALKTPPKPSTVLGAAFEHDCTAAVECGYNLARQRGYWGMQIVNYVCYYAGITQKRALRYLDGKPLTKLKLDK